MQDLELWHGKIEDDTILRLLAMMKKGSGAPDERV